ncbi:MAG: FHA domain-containing protein [Candidatus Aureabacteria bacterium]|nr:FHA domain-containing protein [Candidatus Auribacterota bacterium]
MALLKIIEGVDKGKEVEITRSGFTLGRGKNMDLMLNDPSISRLHAVIHIESKQYRIEDQNSNNGIWVNNAKITSGMITNDDIIIMGNTRLLFVCSPQVSASNIVITSGPEDYDQDKSVMMDPEEVELIKKSVKEEATRKLDLQATQKNYRKLQAMLRISNAVASIYDHKALITELMAIIFAETNATRGFIMLYDETHQLIPAAVRRKDNRTDAITISKTIINTVIREKKAVLSSDMLNDDRFSSGASIIANQIRSCMCAPLSYHDEIFGVIYLDSEITTGIFGQDDLELLCAIANQTSLSIKNFRLLLQIRDEENKRNRLSQYFPPAHVEMLVKDTLDVSLGGKTEDVSIIFCDIRGFTSMSEGMLAMDVMAFLNDFFSVMTEIIFRYEGMVDNFMGDCIMAVFGGPFKHENSPERAVLAAIDMQKAQSELSARFESEGRKTFGIGIGIHSGEVSRGNIGSPQMKKYTVIGSNVNVCSRLCSLAKAGQILVSENTASRLPQHISLKKLDPVKVKNVKKLLTPFQVMY